MLIVSVIVTVIIIITTVLVWFFYFRDDEPVITEEVEYTTPPTNIADLEPVDTPDVEAAVTPDPVDCQVGKWKSWSDCNINDKFIGIQTSKRDITQPAEHGGKACPETTKRRQCTKGTWLPHVNQWYSSLKYGSEQIGEQVDDLTLVQAKNKCFSDPACKGFLHKKSKEGSTASRFYKNVPIFSTGADANRLPANDHICNADGKNCTSGTYARNNTRWIYTPNQFYGKGEQLVANGGNMLKKEAGTFGVFNPLKQCQAMPDCKGFDMRTRADGKREARYYKVIPSAEDKPMGSVHKICETIGGQQRCSQGHYELRRPTPPKEGFSQFVPTPATARWEMTEPSGFCAYKDGESYPQSPYASIYTL